jgi:hypothetical protein
MTNLRTSWNNFFTIGVQSTDEAVLVAKAMIYRYSSTSSLSVDGDVKLKYLRDIFESLIPYVKKHNDTNAYCEICLYFVKKI